MPEIRLIHNIFRFFLASVALVLFLQNPAMADTAAPPALSPALAPQQVRGVQDVVPAGWQIKAQAQGDLNEDGIDDIVLVVRKNNSSKKYANKEEAERHNKNPRRLIVLFGQAEDSYLLALENDRLIPINDHPDDMGDPFDGIAGGGIKIARGTLRLQLGFFPMHSWEMGSATLIFRWDETDFLLIGYERTYHLRNTGDSGETSINYLTQKVKRTERRGDDSDDSDDNATISWKRFNYGSLKRLQDVGNALDFDRGVRF